MSRTMQTICKAGYSKLREGPPRLALPISGLTLGLLFLLSLANCTGGRPSDDSSGHHPCRRPCVEGRRSMRCHYNFHVEEYTTMSKACFQCPANFSDCWRPQCIAANGIQRNVVVANRLLPGPSIEVCLHDEIVVDVVNDALSQSTSIHWHGFDQMETPFMDGVPMVTQCPIPPSTSFRYKFRARNSGSYLWHGHSEFQKADGLFGALIVRRPSDDLAEHVVLITDWSSEETVRMFVENHQSNGTNHPDTILVNGRGDKYGAVGGDQVPRQVFVVKAGERYRFRLISSGVQNCPIKVSIDNHTMLVVAADGYPVEPRAVDWLLIFSGERYDFVLDANASVDSYWMLFQGLHDCSSSAKFQTAILRYEGAPLREPGSRPGGMDGTDGSVESSTALVLKQHQELMMALSSTQADSIALKSDADWRHFLTFDFDLVNNPLYNDARYYPVDKVQLSFRRMLPLFNHIAFVPPSSPLLTQPESVAERSICNETSVGKNCTSEWCSCTYVLHVRLGDVVELFLIDRGVQYPGKVNHPIHLHGQHFHVVAMESFPQPIDTDLIVEMARNGSVARKLHRPVFKDTVNVPQAGFTVIRFHAINAGCWLLHCHMDFHMQTGMALVFKIGRNEDFMPAPRDFPKCGNYGNRRSTNSD